MTTDYFVTLQDLSTTNALFSGNKIYCHCKQVTFDEDNTIDTKPTTFVETEIISDDGDSGSLGSNWTRRKPKNSYVGANQLRIKLVCDFEEKEPIGENSTIYQSSLLSNGSYTLTPFVLFRMKRSDHTFYLYDKRLVDYLVQTELGSDTGYYTTNGIPVIIKHISAVENSNELNIIRYTIDLLEDA